jgi:hypothetical protein
VNASRTTRAERLAMPLARDVVKDVAIEHGACIRPIQLRRTDTLTGQTEPVLIPCGHTLAAVCPACAERARTLRAAQMPGGLASRPRTGPRPRTLHRHPAMVDYQTHRNPGRTRPRRDARP